MGTKKEHAVRRAGYGLAWGKDHPHNMAEPLRGPWQSSQRAELTAAVQMTLAEPNEPLPIRTDSAWTMAGGFAASPRESTRRQMGVGRSLAPMGGGNQQ